MEVVVGEVLVIGGIGVMYMVLLLILVVLSLLPTVVALCKKHEDVLWIFIVNLGLGAIPLVWVFCLVWAFKTDWTTKVYLPKFKEWLKS